MRTLALAVFLASVGLAAGRVVPPEPCFRRADSPVASLDPVQAASMYAVRAAALCYEPLYQYDYAARPYRLLPYAAEAMPDVSEDGRTLTIRLREDVWFGPDACFATPDHRRRATADDFVYSIKRLADAKNVSPGYWTVRGLIEGIEAFHAASAGEGPTDYAMPVSGLCALDDRTVRIRLTRPSTEFVWNLALVYCALVPREAVEAYGKRFGSVEVGSGPFRLAEWRKGHRMLFVRREGRDAVRDRSPACEGVPYRSVEYLIMGDASTRWLSFLDGTFDLATEISRDDWDAVLTPEGELTPAMAARGVRLSKQPALETAYLAFNMDDAVVGGTNAALRRALSMAFDADTWVRFNRGRLSASNGPLPPGVAGRLETPAPYAFDLQRAREALREAGFPDGIDPKTGRRLSLTLELGKTDQETRENAELLASFWDKVGVSLSLSYSTFPQFLQKIRRREAQLFLLSWVLDDPDPLNVLQLFVSSNASPGPNRCNFSDPEYDALFATASGACSDAVRADAVRRMQEIVRDRVPWIFLHYRNEIVLEGPHIRGFRLHDFPFGVEKHWRTEEVP